jgi:hypothetical protein
VSLSCEKQRSSAAGTRKFNVCASLDRKKAGVGEFAFIGRHPTHRYSLLQHGRLKRLEIRALRIERESRLFAVL